MYSNVLGEDLDAVGKEVIVEILVDVEQHLHVNILQDNKFHFLDSEDSFAFLKPSYQGIVVVVTHTLEGKELVTIFLLNTIHRSKHFLIHKLHGFNFVK